MSNDEPKTLSAFELYVLGPAETPPPAGHDLHAGDTCPACGQGTLDYDGTLTLRCPNCGYGAGGCFT
ncbi:MAG: hypothetical protein Fur0018_22820 [Anaerolineales bacterium]